MRRSIIAALVALVCAGALAPRATAQWFKYPTPGVPRTATGAVDVNARTPRTADGKPDLSGIWLAANHQPCPPIIRDGDDCQEKIPLSAWAYRVDAGVKEPLPFQEWAAALRQQRSAANSADDPHAKCLPSNPPRAYTLPHYQKIIQTPHFLALLTEFNASFRQIFTDGRPLPMDPTPSWQGYSSAKWDGDALVIESIGFRDGLWIDWNGSEIGEAANVRERIRRPDYGHLEIAVTMDDPKAYTKPWTVTLKQRIVVDTELVDEICLENEKSAQRMK